MARTQTLRVPRKHIAKMLHSVPCAEEWPDEVLEAGDSHKGMCSGAGSAGTVVILRALGTTAQESCAPLV